MGVKDFWTIVSPLCERKPMWELQDKTIAVDLSSWICECNNIHDKSANKNMYLRNLFFRTSYLLLLDIKPIFVLEGRAPKLKNNSIERRKEAQGRKVNSGSDSKLGDRSRLHSLQKQCEELLKCMGVTCLYSTGEAEALCALLNSKGIVDGVVTQDSDCFLYGGRTIYRNFSISSNGGGTVDMYTMTSIETKLSLGRNKLVVLSILCGCDYNEKGVSGVGKETALKFLAEVEEDTILKRLSSWRGMDSENQDPMNTIENKIRQKAIQDPSFPFLDIQQEFLSNDQDVSGIRYRWMQPNVIEFVLAVQLTLVLQALAERKLAWTADYARDKLLPLLSRWHLLHAQQDVLQLERVVKRRVLRGVRSYEVKWTEFARTTVEPETYLRKKHECAVQQFEMTKKKGGKGKRKQKGAISQIADDFSNLSIGTEMEILKAVDRLENVDNSLTVSDFECSASELLELSSIVESIVSRK